MEEELADAEGIRSAGTFSRPYQENIPLKKTGTKDAYKPPVLPIVIDLTEDDVDYTEPFVSQEKDTSSESISHIEIQEHTPKAKNEDKQFSPDKSIEIDSSAFTQKELFFADHSYAKTSSEDPLNLTKKQELYMKLNKVKRDIKPALLLLDRIKTRENLKKELLNLTIEVMEQRYTAGDFSGKLLAEVSAIKYPKPAFHVPVQKCQVIVKKETRETKSKEPDFADFNLDNQRKMEVDDSSKQQTHGLLSKKFTEKKNIGSSQASLEQNLENMEKSNRELIEENMKLSQNSGSQVQEKYERELMLHAQDMQTMTTLKEKVQELQEKLQPLIQKEKEISQQNDMLAADNNALRAEVKSWQSRTVTNMREIDELKSEKIRIAEELQKKQAEVSQMAANNTALRKEVESAKSVLSQKNADVTKLNRDIAEHNKTLVTIKKIGRKYKTQFDELKVKYDDLEAKSKAADSSNQEQVQEILKKLEESEKNVKELKEEIEREKESATSLPNQAQSKEGKRAIKLLTQFRQKYSQVTSQKVALTKKKNKLRQEKEELKTQIARLTISQEENSVTTISRLEKQLRKMTALHKSEKDYLQKQYDNLYQKVTLPGKQLIKPSLGERTRSMKSFKSEDRDSSNINKIEQGEPRKLGGSDTNKSIRDDNDRFGRSSIISDNQHPEGLVKIQALKEPKYHVQECGEQKTFQRPVFTVPLQNLNLIEGQSAHLKCRLIPVGDPSLKVEWFVNEKPLQMSSRFQTTHDFGDVALDIQYVRPDFNGVYTCRASNELGEAVTTASVKVQTDSGQRRSGIPPFGRGERPSRGREKPFSPRDYGGYGRDKPKMRDRSPMRGPEDRRIPDRFRKDDTLPKTASASSSGLASRPLNKINIHPSRVGILCNLPYAKMFPSDGEESESSEEEDPVLMYRY